jgi:hypothetical protein
MTKETVRLDLTPREAEVLDLTLALLIELVGYTKDMLKSPAGHQGRLQLDSVWSKLTEARHA